MDAPYHVELLRKRSNPLLLALSTLPFLGGLAGLFAALALHETKVLPILPHLLIIGAVLFAWVKKTRPMAGFESQAIVANRHGVRIGRDFLPRAAIAQAAVVPEPERYLVRITPKGMREPIDLVVEDEEHGRRLLHAMGFDASQTVATFRVGSRALAHGKYFGAAAFGLTLAGLALARLGAASDAKVMPLLFPMIFVPVLALFLWPAKLHVGADGLLLTWMKTSRFLPHDEIASATRYNRGSGKSRQTGIDVKLKSGEVVSVPIGSNDWDHGRIQTILTRIDEAASTFREGGGEAEASALRRGERSTKAWIDYLRSLGLGANAEHRTAPLRHESLWRVVEDAGRDASVRAAAAVALGARGDDEDRERLRAAAEATAAPKLRIVLEAVADPAREAEVEAMLEDLEPPALRRTA